MGTRYLRQTDNAQSQPFRAKVSEGGTTSINYKPRTILKHLGSESKHQYNMKGGGSTPLFAYPTPLTIDQTSLSRLSSVCIDNIKYVPRCVPVVARLQPASSRGDRLASSRSGANKACVPLAETWVGLGLGYTNRLKDALTLYKT